ncbi:hypothetical protein [Nocardia sp. R6R-6]|uniref:hypothetical protein n=1 Tax=Nocardia sp. R6R-6 TaxID=3459303 RepID=UPI00403D7299
MALNDGRVVLEFAESDFVVGFDATSAGQQCLMTAVATVRAPAPSLDTWWTRWQVVVPCHVSGVVLIGEVRNGREQFRRMVDEGFGFGVQRRAG